MTFASQLQQRTAKAVADSPRLKKILTVCRKASDEGLDSVMLDVSLLGESEKLALLTQGITVNYLSGEGIWVLTWKPRVADPYYTPQNQRALPNEEVNTEEIPF